MDWFIIWFILRFFHFILKSSSKICLRKILNFRFCLFTFFYMQAFLMEYLLYYKYATGSLKTFWEGVKGHLIVFLINIFNHVQSIWPFPSLFLNLKCTCNSANVSNDFTEMYWILKKKFPVSISVRCINIYILKLTIYSALQSSFCKMSMFHLSFCFCF